MVLPAPEAPSSGYSFLTVVVCILLAWCLGVAAHKAYKEMNAEKEGENSSFKQPDYLALDDNDHYQRLF